MTVHFAAARSTARSPIARALARKALGRVANDNGDGDAADEIVLHAALRHFAAHGLGAARVAKLQAEQALESDDRQAYHWWLGICRTLDKRLAASLVEANGVQAAS